MEEILLHLLSIKPYEKYDILHINWCRSNPPVPQLGGNAGSQVSVSSGDPFINEVTVPIQQHTTDIYRFCIDVGM